MDLSQRITVCQTIADLTILEAHYMLDDNVRALVFEKKVKINIDLEKFLVSLNLAIQMYIRNLSPAGQMSPECRYGVKCVHVARAHHRLYVL